MFLNIQRCRNFGREHGRNLTQYARGCDRAVLRMRRLALPTKKSGDTSMILEELVEIRVLHTIDSDFTPQKS
jgi:hypothetical protein